MATYDIQLSDSAHDAEESSGGSMTLDGNGLDIGQNTVGVRFRLDVAKDSTIDTAYISLVSRGNYADPCQVNFQAQLSEDAPAITSTDFNLTNRAPFTGSYSRTLPAWTTGNTYTVDIADILQAVVNQAGWVANNWAFLLITGEAGRRSAHSYNSAPASAPAVHVEYSGTTFAAFGSMRMGTRLGGVASTSALYNAAGAMRTGQRLGGVPTLETTFTPTGSMRNAMRLGGTAYVSADSPAVGHIRTAVRLGGRATVVNAKPFYVQPARMVGAKMNY
ncbi:MAG: hypothetical protein H6641_15660 [Caldilineaceae bacterium]|nr:hypothetical protein [Caldilineaceae bacterium]